MVARVGPVAVDRNKTFVVGFTGSVVEQVIMTANSDRPRLHVTMEDDAGRSILYDRVTDKFKFTAWRALINSPCCAVTVRVWSDRPCGVWVHATGTDVAVNTKVDVALAGTQFPEPILAALRLMWDTF